jgi:dTDP-4-amino-4,6-dideoxygalactose transaminase
VSVFLGFAANYSPKQVFAHLFATGGDKQSAGLIAELNRRYQGEKAVLYSSGRSALAAAIKTTVPVGSKVAINGLTCYAVVQAVKAAGCEPVYIDIDPRTLNFSAASLEQATSAITGVRAVIIQNTLGVTVGVANIEKLAKKHNFKIIEDLAHCAGRHYPDGREVGTVGVATALSFGKGKSIDTVSGGALVLRVKSQSAGQNAEDFLSPARAKSSISNFRDRLYPLFGLIVRSTYDIKIGKFLAAALFKLGLVKRSADGRVDLKTKLPNWQAALALKQLRRLKETPIRDFALIKNRPELLGELSSNGYHLDDIWYDVPVSPKRYYSKVGFPENSCPETVKVAKEIINLPTNYSAGKLAIAKKLIEKYQ